jgi:butyrate kinase
MAVLYNILVLNIGSTTAKVAYFENDQLKVQETIQYALHQFESRSAYLEQSPRRKEEIESFLVKHKIEPNKLDMVVSRGGLTAPLSSGVYLVDASMCEDLRSGKYGEHPTNLGPLIANDLTKESGCKAVIVDGPSTDEYQPLARISGTPEIERRSAFHALNQKAAARRAAEEIGVAYEDANMVVAHLGGGITVGAHRKGRVIDSTIGVGEGPMTPERSGNLPIMDLLRLLESGQFNLADFRLRLTSQGGLIAYLGTNDVSQVEAMIQEGNEKASLILEAMAYQIAKDIGAMSTVLDGRVDVIVLTGGLANSLKLVDWIIRRVGYIAPCKVYPGQSEMVALAQGALRVLLGREGLKRYFQPE